jgi:hypothetical protein
LVLGAAQVVALIAVGVALMAALRAFRRAQAAADDATTQAHRAAEASELRAQAAERALAESARPWVTAEALTLLRPEVWRQGRLDARLELLVRNSGPSPADNLRVTLTPAPSPDAATTDAFRHEGVAFFDARPRAVAQAWPDVFNDAPQALPLSVAPGQGVVQAVRLSSPEVTLKDIVPGGLLVFGRLDYADAQGRAHVTRFAFQLMNRDGAWRFDPRPALGALD